MSIRRAAGHAAIVAIALVSTSSTRLCADFVRGDANRDGQVNVADAVTHILALFRGDVSLSCDDAADANDDGALDLADAQSTLLLLFAGGDPLPYPGALRDGPDPTCDPLGCADQPDADATNAIVFSEINYNPRGNDRRREFVELYNRTDIPIDVSGYQFTNGITFTMPEGTVVPPNDFLVVLAYPDFSRWPALDALKVGPFEGTLADGGERLTLSNGNCTIESVRYNDRPPWPIGADGYGPALERIDYAAPADDFHSWRTSFRQTGPALGGTPGLENTTLGTPTHPTIAAVDVEPEAPRSADSVNLTVVLDAPPDTIRAATLRWETAADVLTDMDTATMQVVSTQERSVTLRATIPPAPSQVIVRANILVELTSDETTILPHPADQGAFISYFVFDGEVETKLPLLWLFPRLETALVDFRLPVSGAAIQDLGDAFPTAYDGAEVRRRMSNLNPQNGHNLTFLKGQEFRDDRTINLIEALADSAHVEHLAFQVFREIGARASWTDWFRVIDYTMPSDSEKRHSQRTIVQQVNKRFLDLNDLDNNGDLYKLDRNAFIKRTNPHSGDVSIDTITTQLDTEDAAVVRDLVFSQINIDSVCLYSVGIALTGHTDSTHNNLYFYNDLTPTGKWELFPWDMDGTFRCPEMIVSFPIFPTGPCTIDNWRPNLISRSHHLQSDLDQVYRDLLSLHISPGGKLTEEAYTALRGPIEKSLLEDLTLMETYLGRDLTERRNRITNATSSMLNFVRTRGDFLRNALAEDAGTLDEP